MFNTELFRPVNLLIVGVITLIFVSTLGKFFKNHVEKDATK